jgi:hypothetical protein
MSFKCIDCGQNMSVEFPANKDPKISYFFRCPNIDCKRVYHDDTDLYRNEGEKCVRLVELQAQAVGPQFRRNGWIRLLLKNIFKGINFINHTKSPC